MNYNNYKKAQVTLFVVIAIVLLSAVLVVIFLFPKSSSENKFSEDAGINAKYNELRTQIINCEEFSSRDALDLIGTQGGYYKVPKESYDLGFIKIPYFYYEDGKRILIPSNTEVEKQLGLFVDDVIKICLDNIDNGEFKITYGTPKTITKISEDSVLFRTDLSVVIERELSVSMFNLKDFSVDIDSKLLDMLDYSRRLLENHKTNPDLLCITCLTNLNAEKGFLTDVRRFNLDSESSLITINPNNTETNPFVFEFLEKYKLRTEVEI